MKKLLLLGLALLLLGSALFADDAKVMPARIGRFYLAPNFSFANGAYNKDGDKQSFEDDGSIKVFNLGFALEYGITKWITGALQWAPGWTIWSDISSAAPAGIQSAATGQITTPFDGDITTNGVADLFLGAKIQIIGPAAPVQTDMFRLAIAPGLAIPLPGPDFSDEVENAMKGDKAKFSTMDKHTLGAGGRFYFDYNIGKYFFINLYNETLFYPIKKDLNKDGPNLAILKETILTTAYDAGYYGVLGPILAGGGTPTAAEMAAAKTTGDTYRAGTKAYTDKLEGEVNYKYRLTFEIEPALSMPLSDGALVLGAGLPVNYVFSPAYDYSVDGLDKLVAAASGMGMDMTEDYLLEQGKLVGKNSHILTLKPNVSLMLMKIALPLEFKLQYSIPLYGQNANATNTIAFQIRAYFKI